MPYGRCGCCNTNFACATPTFCPFIIISHTNFDLLVTILRFGHTNFRNQGVVVTVAAIGKHVDAASTNHRSLRLFTALSVVSCQQGFTAISNQRRSVGSCLTLIGARGPLESRCLFLLIAKK